MAFQGKPPTMFEEESMKRNTTPLIALLGWFYEILP
jgi:hypothetical protein